MFEAPSSNKLVETNRKSLSITESSSSNESSSKTNRRRKQTRRGKQRRRASGHDRRTNTSSSPNKSQCRQPHNHDHDDLSPEEQELYVAMDCEMVGVGPCGCHSVLARVTLLNWNGHVVLDTLVRPQQEVTDYRTFVSGISAEDFSSSSSPNDSNTNKRVMDFEPCRELVLSLIDNKIVIGHGLKNDFHALQIYDHPWYLQRDTTKYEPFQRDEDINTHTTSPARTTAVSPSRQNQSYFINSADSPRRPKARKLKDLVYEKLHRTIQPIGCFHDPVEDALGALDLYKLVRVKWEKCMAYKIAKTNQILLHHMNEQSSLSEHDYSCSESTVDLTSDASSSSSQSVCSEEDSSEDDGDELVEQVMVALALQ